MGISLRILAATVVAILMGGGLAHAQSEPAPSESVSSDEKQAEPESSPSEPDGDLACSVERVLDTVSRSQYGAYVPCLRDPAIRQELRVLYSESGGRADSTSSTPSDCGDVSISHIGQRYSRANVFTSGDPGLHTIPEQTVSTWATVMCENGEPALGYPTGLEVLLDDGRLRTSDYCSAGRAGNRVSVGTAAAGSCETHSRFAEVEHLYVVNGPNEIYRAVLFVDLDRDGNRGAGEPYTLVLKNYDRSASDGLYVRASHPIPFARSGWTVWRKVQLRDRSYRPLPYSEVRVRVDSGPSQFRPITCYIVPTSHARFPVKQDQCTTNKDGYIYISYSVRRVPQELDRYEADNLMIFIDSNGNSSHQEPEPVTYYEIRIAKPIHYVALGDSYSAGETGESDEYLSGVNPADLECHRWEKAYPFVLEEFLKGLYFKVETFACTGATTINIHATGASRDCMPGLQVFPVTNRPSPHAPDCEPNNPDQSNWEPRQAVSLDDADVRPVDLVTITIGGNDAGFAAVLKECLSPSGDGCDQSDVGVDDETAGTPVATVRRRVRTVLQTIKDTAEDATIVVLGYPFPTPARIEGSRVISADDVLARCSALSIESILEEVGVGAANLDNLPGIVGFIPLSGLLGIGQDALDVGDAALRSKGRIDSGEAQFLLDSGLALNQAIESAAREVGVHHVNVAFPTFKTGFAESFLGHSPCAPGAESWLNGLDAVSADLVLAAADSRSFHPNETGQRMYANLLSQFILTTVSSPTPKFQDTGLPRNPDPDDSHIRSAPHSDAPAKSPSGTTASSHGTSADRQSSGQSARAAEESAGEAVEESAPSPEFSVGLMVPRRPTSAGAVCGRPFAVPGETLELAAEGFAPGSAVSILVAGATLGGGALTPPVVPSVTADARGRIAARWTVPSAPPAGQDAVPRLYELAAAGTDAEEGSRVAYLVVPLVAYPGTRPCAVEDQAATGIGESVRIAVLANDVAPQGGSLDPASVQVEPVSKGAFTVDVADGSMRFAPHADSVGTVRTSYLVRDRWGVGVRGEITVAVGPQCTITGTPGVASIEGTEGDDVICVPDPADRDAFHIIDAKGGDDIVIGSDGVDWVYGGAGRDTIYGRGGGDIITGGSGTDTIHSGGGTDTIFSLDRFDAVHSDADDEVVIVAPEAAAALPPQARDDHEHAAAGATVTIHVLDNDHDPSEDLDTSTLAITSAPASGTATVVTSADFGAAVEYTAASQSGIDTFAYQICDSRGACATAEVTVTVGTNGCTIIGTAASDTLRGTPGDDVICGLGGDDEILGLGGNDTLIGGAGDDTLTGGNGDDVLFGGAGDDTLTGDAGDDILYGGEGDDTLWGNTQNDVLLGGAGTDALNGGGHNDILYGGAGDDTVEGHAGDDMLSGNWGDDTLTGGNGDDVLTGGEGDDRLEGGADSDSLYGGAGDDTLHGHTQSDDLHGGAGNDTLYGGGHSDHLEGGAGDDSMWGNAGDDALSGGPGDDTLTGGEGNDELHGGPDTDTCHRGETLQQCETPTDSARE